tara:strand:+ start:103 stop:309 length:207 start_codon:yes stop_codon:yes gene_type:complete
VAAVAVLTQVAVLQQAVFQVVQVVAVETTAGHIQPVLVLLDKDLLVVMVQQTTPILTAVVVVVVEHQK